MEEDDFITLIVILALIVVALVLVLFVFFTMTGDIAIPNKLNIGVWCNGSIWVSKTFGKSSSLLAPAILK